MLEEYFGPINNAVNERVKAGAQVVIDFHNGKVTDRDELLRLIGAIDFMGDAGLIYQDLYDMVSYDLDIVLASYPDPVPENKEPLQVCCICGEEFAGRGHSPHPIKSEGVCCSLCNFKVIAARIALSKKS